MGVRETFSNNVRAYRTHAGLTQEELAEKSGLHRNYIGRIEQRRENPTLGSAAKIAAALGIDFALFFVDASGVERLGAEGRTAADYDEGDCALCTWTDDGLQFEPIETDDPDQTLRILSILAKENPDNLTEAYFKVRERLLLGEDEDELDSPLDQSDE